MLFTKGDDQMSIFSKIASKIFGTSEANAAPAQAGAASSSSTKAPTATAGAPTGAAASQSQAVDVAAVLTEMASKSGQKLDWRHSIVDLMKLLNIDSSLSARKELAGELNYSGDTSDSAAMNIWLHKQVMAKLAANGGKVPDDLK